MVLRILALVLAFVLAIIGNRSVLPEVEYALAPQIYAKFCENKAEPMKGCQGKCQKNKAIAKALDLQTGQAISAPAPSPHEDKASLHGITQFFDPTRQTDLAHASALRLESVLPSPTPPPPRT